ALRLPAPALRVALRRGRHGERAVRESLGRLPAPAARDLRRPARRDRLDAQRGPDQRRHHAPHRARPRSRRDALGDVMLRTHARFGEVARDARHYESFYVKACHPSEPRAVWIRHTAWKAPGAEAVGSLWCTLFDAGWERPVAFKETRPPGELGVR